MGGQESAGYFFGRTRYVILLLSLLALTFAFANSLVFTFTVICMDDVIPTNSTDHWLQSPSKVNSLFSAIAIGCLVGTIPISYLIQKIGIGKTTALYGLCSAVGTLFFPLAVAFGQYPGVFFIRILQGVPTALSFPAMGQISAQWATDKGLGSFLAILSTYMQLCCIFSMPVSSAFCTSSMGWRGSYYVHGVVSTLVYIAMYLFYHDNPAKHRAVSSQELQKISRGKSDQAKKTVPYRAILSDPCVYSLLISLVGSTSGYQIFLLYGPTYLNKVLGLDVRSTGWGTTVPFILSGLVKFCLGPISDKASCISPRARLIVFTLLSQGLLAVSFVVMALTTSSIAAQGAYTGAIVASGLVSVGTFKGASMVFCQHVHFVMAISSFLLVLIVLGIPQAVAFVCPNNSADEWSHLFLYFAVFVLLASAPYMVFARDKPAPWTRQDAKQSKNSLSP